MNIFLKSSGKKFEDAEMKRIDPKTQQSVTKTFKPEEYVIGNMTNAGVFVAD